MHDPRTINKYTKASISGQSIQFELHEFRGWHSQADYEQARGSAHRQSKSKNSWTEAVFLQRSITYKLQFYSSYLQVQADALMPRPWAFCSVCRLLCVPHEVKLCSETTLIKMYCSFYLSYLQEYADASTPWT